MTEPFIPKREDTSYTRLRRRGQPRVVKKASLRQTTTPVSSRTIYGAMSRPASTVSHRVETERKKVSLLPHGIMIFALQTNGLRIKLLCALY